MREGRLKIQAGDIFSIESTQSTNGTSKVILIISNEFDEEYDRLVPTQGLLVEKKPKGLFSLPFLNEQDDVWFAHAYYSPAYQFSYLERFGSKIGHASDDVVELARMVVGRRFTDDPDYFRGLVEEVVRYNSEMKELTGNDRIITDPKARYSSYGKGRIKSKDLPEKEEKKPETEKIPSIGRVAATLRKQPRFLRDWTSKNLFLLLDASDTYGPLQLGKEIGYKGEHITITVCAKKRKAKKILLARGFDLETREKTGTKKKEPLLEPEEIPKRSRPEYMFSPKTWSKNELKIFCEDLDTYTMPTIQKMYNLNEPLKLQKVDEIRSCYLAVSGASTTTKISPPPIN